MAITFSVKPTKGLNVRTGAGTSYKKIGAMPYKATCVTVKDTPTNGWYNIKYGSITGWASGTYLTKVSSTSTTTTTATKTTSTGVDNTENLDKASNAGISASKMANIRYEHFKAVHALGCPPMYNQYVDLQYIDDVAPGVGRVFATTMLSNPTILSLCPGKVQYMPGFSDKTKDTFMEYIKDMATGQDFASKVTNSLENKLNGKLFEFKSDFAEYCKVFNLLCRMTAIILGIGENTYPRTWIKYKSFDYAYITQTDNASTGQSNNGSIFKNGIYAIKKGLTTAVEDNNYMHFFITNQGTSLSESSSTSLEDSIISDYFGGSSELSKLAREAEFLMGGTNYKAVANDVANATTGSESWLGSMGNIFANYLKGGRLVLPKMLGDAQYDKSFSCTCKFVSPYGNKESIFLRCYVPLMAILAMSLPKQIADNMYTYPFLVRAFQKGFFNTDLAVISSLQITRGGSDDTAWTIDGLSTELEVRFDITPLYSRMMVTSSDNPVLFFKNTALIEYLGTICGLDFKMNNLAMKKDIVVKAVAQKFSIRDGIDNLGRSIGDTVESTIGKFFKLMNL